MNSPSRGHRQWAKTLGETRSKLRTLAAFDAEPGPKAKERLAALEVHGLAAWMKTSGIAARIGWSSVMMAALLALVYGLCRSTQDFLHNPILTSIHLRPVDALSLPQFLLCPSNKVNRTKALLSGADTRWASFFGHSDWGSDGDGEGELGVSVWRRLLPERQPSWAQEEMPAPPADFQAFTHCIVFALDGDYALQDYMGHLGYELPAFLQSCFMHNHGRDCAEMARPVFHRTHGKCFLLQAGRDQTSPGAGLSLLLHLHPEESLDDDPPPFDGLRLTLAPTISPATLNEILVPPSSYAKMSLSATRMELAHLPGRGTAHRCLDDHAAAHFQVINSTIYSRELCELDCSLFIVIQSCEKLLPIDREWVRSSFHEATYDVNLRNATDCALTAVAEKAGELIECANACHQPCMSWTYSVRLSSLPFPSKALKAHPDSAKINGVVILDIAFDALQYTDIVQQESMTMETFVSNLGGQMGIWLGASLLTIVQAGTIAIGTAVSFVIAKLRFMLA